MSLLREALRALRLTAALWLITVVLYPLPLLALGQGLVSDRANGSLLEVDGRVVGSALIGQPFAGERYFWSRPSAIGYSTGPQPASGPSNLGPTNPDLVRRVAATSRRLQGAGLDEPAADLLVSSGSGLDPHITPRAAEQQIRRLARVRRLPPEQLRQLVQQHTQGRILGVLGEPRVNVLQLNLALDRLALDTPALDSPAMETRTPQSAER